MTTVKWEKTLLDEFAMAALTGLLAKQSDGEKGLPLEFVVRDAFKIAQLMVKQRGML